MFGCLAFLFFGDGGNGQDQSIKHICSKVCRGKKRTNGREDGPKAKV